MPLHRTVSDWGPWKRSQGNHSKEAGQQHFHSAKNIGRPKSIITYSSLDLGEDYKHLYRRRSAYESEKYRKSPSIGAGYELNQSPPSSTNSVFSDVSSVSRTGRTNNNRHSFAFGQEAVDIYSGEEIKDRENPFRREPTREKPLLSSMLNKSYAQTQAWIQNSNHQPQYKEERRLSDRSDQFQRDQALDETSKVLTQVKLRKREAFLQKENGPDQSLLKSSAPSNSSRQGRYKNGQISARWSLDLSNIEKERNALFNVFKNDGIVSKVGSRTNSFKENYEPEPPQQINIQSNDHTEEKERMNNRKSEPQTVQNQETSSNKITSKKKLEKSWTEDSDEYIIAEGPNHENTEAYDEDDVEIVESIESDDKEPGREISAHKEEVNDPTLSRIMNNESHKDIREKEETNKAFFTNGINQEDIKFRQPLMEEESEYRPEVNQRSHKEDMLNGIKSKPDAKIHEINLSNNEVTDFQSEGNSIKDNEEDQRRPSFLPLENETKAPEKLEMCDDTSTSATDTKKGSSQQTSPIVERIKEIRQFVAAAAEKLEEGGISQSENIKHLDSIEREKKDDTEEGTSGIFWADLVQIEECEVVENFTQPEVIRSRISSDQRHLKIRDREANRRKSWMLNTLEDQEKKKRNRHSTHFVDLL